MELNSKVLYDKIMGCWNGKNIGGFLGAPLEGHRGVFDLQFYLQKDMDGNPPPNDDLDLQCLHALSQTLTLSEDTSWDTCHLCALAKGWHFA